MTMNPMEICGATAVAESEPQIEQLMQMVRHLPFPAFICKDSEEIVCINYTMHGLLGLSTMNGAEFNNLHQFESLLGVDLSPAHLVEQPDGHESSRLFFSSLDGKSKHCRVSEKNFRLVQNDYRVYYFMDDSRIVQLEDNLTKMETEMSIFSQVASALGSSLSVEEILQIILIAVTAKEGLGFNRAFLFLISSEDSSLQGHLAVGPSSPEEAYRIWTSLASENMSLREVLKRYMATLGSSENQLSQKVRAFTCAINQGSALLHKVVSTRQATIVSGNNCLCGKDCSGCVLNGVDEFAVVPMVSGEKLLGIIAADNLITSRPITGHSLAQLQVFADQAAVALERTRLHESISAHLRELEEANNNLRKTQDELLKMEKVSLWSELAYDITHELRNPASIIGGFAALMMKSNQLTENLQEQAGIIFSECQRLEKALGDVLDFSKSFSQELAQFDFLEVVREVCKIIQAKFTKNAYVINPPPTTGETALVGRKDQIKFALYNICTIFEERLEPGSVINIHFQAADNNIRATFQIADQAGKAPELLNDFANPRTGKLGLKLSMAFEAIKYNGGSVGLESGIDNPIRIYMELPISRSHSA